MRFLESIDRDAIARLLKRDEYFWLDPSDPGKDEVAALEDLVRRGQPPKLEDSAAAASSSGSAAWSFRRPGCWSGSGAAPISDEGRSDFRPSVFQEYSAVSIPRLT